MPEGPEIRRAADRVAGVLLGKTIESVQFGMPRLETFEKRLAGCTVSAVETRGKAMLTRFDNGLTLYSHNQLYGRWMISPRGQYPSTRRSLRVALHTRQQSALLYSASDIEVLDSEGLSHHPFLSRIGPDLLDPQLTAQDIAERLRLKRFFRRSLAALYLDQHFLAGLGNYLRSEILFSAALHPMLRPVDVTDAQLHKLSEATLKLAWRSYRTRGITLPGARHRAVRSSGSHGEAARFWVFARAGQPCYRCAATIQRENRSGRRIYRCPNCQSR